MRETKQQIISQNRFLCLHEVIYKKLNNSDILRDHKIVLSKYSKVPLNPDELNRQKQVHKYFAESGLQLRYIQNNVCNIERSIFFFNDCVHGRVEDISTRLQNDLLNIGIILQQCFLHCSRKQGSRVMFYKSSVDYFKMKTSLKQNAQKYLRSKEETIIYVLEI